MEDESGDIIKINIRSAGKEAIRRIKSSLSDPVHGWHSYELPAKELLD